MTEPVDIQNPSQEAAQSPAPAPAVPASPVVVDAPPSAAAPGADIVGHSEQPLPGEQPGVVAETPVVAQSAADQHPESSVAETGDDPRDEGDYFDGDRTGELDTADEFSDTHPSKQPVALRPTPAGPTSSQPARVQRAREESR